VRDPKSITTRFPINYGQPTWSPDGTQFALIANQNAGNWLCFELFGGGSETAQIEAWTHLTTYYSKVFVQSYSWSPDGHRVAAWFVPNPEGDLFTAHGQSQLAILDLVTGEVTNTCIPGDYEASPAPPNIPPPLWSPDSQQILVENRYSDANSQVLLVDLALRSAMKLGDNIQPLAWLAAKQ
jgi:Tol biopolymer transport system component